MGEPLVLPKLHYRESGVETAPPLFLLHGLFASLQNWQSVVKLLNHQFRVINVDLPNHGGSPHTLKFNFQESIDAIIALMDQLQLEKVTMIGHSLGGKIAMLLALQYPQRVSNLIVEDIAPKTYPPWFSTAMRAMQELNLSTLTSRMQADEKLSLTIPNKELRSFLLTNLQRSEHGYKWRVNLEALIAGGPEISGFPKVTNSYSGPTLFIKGSQSVYIHSDDRSLIENYFPHATIETFHGADHWVHTRDPLMFAQQIISFVTT